MAAEIASSERLAELPALADALAEAGCDDPALLGHLRQARHWPACWALRSVLGGGQGQV